MDKLLSNNSIASLLQQNGEMDAEVNVYSITFKQAMTLIGFIPYNELDTLDFCKPQININSEVIFTDGITVKFSNTSFSLFNTSNINIKALRLSSALFTLLSGAALFLTEAEKALFYRSSDILDGGALRVSYATSLPGVVLRLSYVYNLMFCIYLATLPEKKKCRWMFLLFIVIRAMKLIYGSRGDFVLCLMFAYIYYWMRDIKNKKSGETGEKWLGKAEKTLLVASIPAIIILMVFIGYYRTNTAFHFSGFFDTLYEFFFSQGVSIDVLGNTQKYINDFNQPHFLYMFDNTYQFLVTNPISKIITGKTYYAANTVERALYGTSLGQTLYYNINPQSYLAGNGCGSAYLAEAYLGYGIVGVFVINFLLERIMNRISKAKSNNVASLTIRLLFILNLFFMPRSGFDVFIGDFTSVTHILALIMLWVLYKILSGKDFGDNYAETSQKG